jgi:hypothetical protein
MHVLDSQLPSQSSAQEEQERRTNLSDVVRPASSSGGGGDPAAPILGAGILSSFTSNQGEPSPLVPILEVCQGGSRRSSSGSSKVADGSHDDSDSADEKEQQGADTGQVVSSTRISRHWGSPFRPPRSDVTVSEDRSKNLIIIRSIMRISLGVSVLWIVLACLNICSWAYFYIHGSVSRIYVLLLMRLICMR